MRITDDMRATAPKIQEVGIRYCVEDWADGIDKELSACAAGPWRTDVENAPKDMDLLCHIKNGGSVMVALGDTERFQGNGWTILAFAIPNPPETKP